MAQKPGRTFQKKEPKEYDEEVIQIDRVTRVVKGGRKLRFRATVVIGNRKGKVGIGVGKSNEVTGAIQKAIAKAKKTIKKIILNGTTIPHDIKIKHKASRILLMPASPGTGVIAGGPIRKVLEIAGVKDILSKSYGTTNKVNNTKATFEALMRLRTTPWMTRQKAQSAKNNSSTKSEKPASQNKTEKTVVKKDDLKAEKSPIKKSVAPKPAEKMGKSK